jgi:REP-associated tyrosine transposase
VARPLRIEFPGAVYHITSRGNARQNIFLDERDHAVFLEILCSSVERFQWLLHAYCLMSNHYHLLIETPRGRLSRGMRQINGVYTQQFNRGHNRVGHVLQGRYTAVIVDRDAYLLELCRYVVLNPVRAHVVERPEQWKWSSYSATLGYSKGISCLTTDWILAQFGNERKEAIKRYREFVHAGIKEESPLKKVKGQMFLGEDRFLEKFKGIVEGKETLREIPKVQRYIARPSLEKIFKDTMLEGKSAYRAHVTYGYTLRQIAEYLDVHYSTISRAVKRTEDERKK